MENLDKNNVPQQAMRGRENFLKKIIKSNKALHALIYKILRCNRFVFILRNSRLNTDSLFETIAIETCSICNRKCSFCPMNQDTTPKGLMSNELFDKIIRELKEISFKGDVAFSNYGEPLLDKRIVDFTKKVKKELGNRVMFSTNGDFLTPQKFRELISAGFDIFHVSQHDSEPSKTIKDLFSKTSPQEWKYISYEIVKNDSVTLTNRGGLVEVKTYYPFYCALRHVIVRANGEVSFCCNDYYNEVKLGNIKQEKLIDIWNKPLYRQIRNEIKRGIFNLPICKRCRGILPQKS